MPLVDVDLPVAGDAPLPADVRRFVREADDRIRRFQSDGRLPAFVPCTFPAAYLLLRALAESALIRGPQFCEFGSGFGVVASLASMVGFDACGIEIEGELVEEARGLAEDFSLTVEFVQGSFIPRGAEDRVHASGSYSWLYTEGDDAYDDLGLDLSDMDVVFSYPWPDEQGVTAELFERYAGDGALLITCQNGSDFGLRRKMPRRRGRGKR